MNVTSHGSVCPKLTYLDIDCPCDREIISYVRLMHTFPVLEHVCLQGDLSFSTSLTFVTTVRKIHLRGVNIPWRLRKYIISFTPRVPLFKDIPTILAAKKMECVHVTIGRRTEMAFAQYAELFKVKSLRVTWGRDGTRRYIPGFLYRANVGMPSRIATSCNVTDLALNNVWICPGELALILEQHGPILKRFEFSVVGQYEGIVGQMIRLLKDVLMYCADLRVLLAYDIDRAFEEVCMGGFFVEKEDREVLKDCVERMKRDRWWLEWKDIRKLCERIVATPEPDSS